jgi:PEP-CTERM motif
MDQLVTNLFKAILPATACAQVLLVGLPASATPIIYGDFAGTNVTFQQVTEDSATNPNPSLPLPLYGPPTVSGDGLFFNPTAAFSANVSNGANQITDGKLTTTLVTNSSGGTIHNILVTERGDYTLAGAGTSATNVSVSAPVQLTLTGVNGGSVSPVALFSGNVVFTPAGGSYNLASNPGTGVIWTGSLLINIDALMTNNGGGRATQIQYVMDNTLVAFSQSGTIAFIEKKNGFVDLVANVPEPSTWVLAVLGSLALAWHARRRAG